MSLLAARYARLAQGLPTHVQPPPGAAPVPQPREEPQADREAVLPFDAKPSPHETSDPARAGLVRWEGGCFEHYCAACGAWGAFGFDVDLKKDRLGVWYCAEHRPGQEAA